MTPCPNQKNHTPHPSGYIANYEWAKAQAKTHKQTRCPDCGLWVIWTPKPSKVPVEETP